MKRSWVEQVMGMPVSVLLRGPGAQDGGAQDGAAQDAVAALYDELREVDATFSTWRTDSAVNRLRQGEVDLDDCPPEVREVATLCEQARERTGGAFDARSPDGTWDPSGLVKGWAAERAARHLAALTGLDWCLNAGGDVVLDCPSGEGLGVGVQDPADPGAVVAVLSRRTGAVATSGTSARGQHLWDPRTGQPADAVVSVTVVGPSLLWADVWATACCVRGDLDLLPDGVEGLLLAADSSRTSSPGWQALLA